ncbi:uncharacterized protein EAE98_004363 [Botrytis deweyae]|uniref:Uncharacterized protein n=1 Tax=Botrytis deweyae TaxID=2478750 RepID=A0ABQ7IQN5_9HELO|nr:uncharacterized protein EAE98_004363 [Botrytis deweyae]KAF7931627.1 hypothetical protein EAE98_004363 [Botrytis deweyae]
MLGGSPKHSSSGKCDGRNELHYHLLLIVVETFFLWLQKIISLILGQLRYYINLNVTNYFAFGHLVNLKRYRED